jgi:hypothetical protein
MYLAMIILLMAVFPALSVLIECSILHTSADVLFLIGKWFVFWGVGVRLMLAGLRQIANPTFTADVIFGVKEKAALTIVQELGFANLSIGLLGVLALVRSEWIVPAAITGGLFYGLAGVKHLIKGDRNRTENIAMVSDLFIFLVLAGYLAGLMLRAA